MVSTQGFELAKQKLYRLSHTSSPSFAVVILEIGSHELFDQAGLKPQSS
jgi:hypothetical protein